jgi:nanoRNase/pAp phosphatase (c-di-AMP/oligoRNAs hydrolase)
MKPARTIMMENVDLTREAQLSQHGAGFENGGRHERNLLDLRWFVGIPPVEDGLLDQVVVPIDPSMLPVPEAVLMSLMEAQRVLVLGHVPPDVDCTGSALALGRLLRSRNQHADICVDAPLPGICRSFVRPGEVVRYEAIRDRDYDLVVLVDAAQADRFGAAKEAIIKARKVLIIDHHHVQVDAQTLGLKSSTRLVKWIEPEVDAAALLVARLVTRMAPPHADSMLLQVPLCGGILTDTDRFRHQGTHWSSLAQLKFLLEQVHGGLSTLDAHFSYRLPRQVCDLLALAPEVAPDAPAHLVRRAHELLAAGKIVREESLARSNRILSLPKEMACLALEWGTHLDLQTTIDDIKGALFDRLNALILTTPLAVLLCEDSGGTQIGIRSQRDGMALALGHHLGGGGKARMAGAYLNEPIGKVQETIRAWALTQDTVDTVENKRAINK